MQCPGARSIASGLAPPFAGKNAFNHIQKYTRGIILVNEDEIKSTVAACFNRGLLIEPAGTAALAAILTGKVSNIIIKLFLNALKFRNLDRLNGKKVYLSLAFR